MKIKRILSVAIALGLLLTALKVPMNAVAMPDNTGNFVISEDGVLSAYNGTQSEIIIPSTVVTIGNMAIANKDFIVSVTIPDTVKKIESSAFSGDTKLTTVNFEDSTSLFSSLSFESYVFGNTAITSMILPSQTSEIGDNTFGGMNYLKYLVFDSDKVKFNKNAFSNTLNDTYLPVLLNPGSASADSLKSAMGFGNKFVFRDKTNLTPDDDFANYIVNSDGVLLSYKGTETALSVPADVTEINHDAFANNTTVTSIHIPLSVKKIGTSAVISCPSLKSITFENAPEEDISKYSLEICSYSLQGTGDSNDATKPGLTEIVLPNYKVILDQDAFFGIRNLKGITVNSKTMGYTKNSFRFLTGIPVFFPKDNTDSQAFTGFTAKDINGNYAIYGYGTNVCYRYLEENGTADYDKVNKDFIIDGDGRLWKYIGKDTEVRIPETVISIESATFKPRNGEDGCNNITKIIVPLSVEKIGTSMAEGCMKLQSVDFMNPDTGKEKDYNLEICPYAFLGTSIQELTLPTHTTQIGDSAFCGAGSLKKVVILATDVSYNQNAIKYVPRAYLPIVVPYFDCETYKGLAALAQYGTNAYAILPSQEINDNFAIDKDGNLIKYLGSEAVVTIPDTVKTIKKGAFKPADSNDGCNKVTKIIIPCTVEKIELCFAEGCSGILQVEFLNAPKGEEEDHKICIDEFAFLSTGVTEISLPNYIVDLGPHAFASADHLKGVIINGKNAIYDRESFQYITRIPVFFPQENKDSTAFQNYIRNYVDAAGNETEESYIKGMGFNSYFRYLEADGTADYSKINKNFIIDGDGALYKYSGTEDGISQTEIKIPNGVTVIKSGAFKPNDSYKDNVLIKKDPCHDIIKIIVPYTVKELETSMIEGCEALTEIEFQYAPQNETDNYNIKIDAFSLQGTGYRTGEKDADGNDIVTGGLTEISLPNYPVTLDYGAFGGIKNIKGIIVNGTTINCVEIPKQAETDLPRTGAFNFLPCIPVFFHKANNGSKAFTDFTKMYYDKENNPHPYVESYGEGVYYLYLSDDGTADYSKINPEFIVNGDGVLTKYMGHYSDLHIPETVTEVADGIFSNHPELTRVVIPGTCKKFRNVVFANDINLTEVVFNEGFETLGSWCFQNTGIKELILPASLKRMEPGAGCGLTNVEYIAILSKDVDMDKTAFEFYEWNYNLPVIVPEGSKTAAALPTMGGYGKEGNNRFFMRYLSQGKPNKEFSIDYNGVLTKYNGAGGDVVVPNGVTELAEAVFANNDTLKSISLPATLKKINNVAFNKSTKLLKITFNEGLEDVGLWAFQNTAITELALPSTITSLPNGALCGMPDIQKITIYAKEVAVENNCCFLNNPDNPPEIYVVRGSRTEKAFGIVDNKNNCNFVIRRIGEVLNPDFKILDNILTAYTGSDEKVVIPDYVTEIGKEAFLNNKNLKEIVIPSSVHAVGDDAFKGCCALSNVQLNEGLETIGTWSFSETALKEIELPSTVKSIKTGAFGKNPALKDVYCYSYNLKLPTTLGGKGAFAECNDVCIHAAEGSEATAFMKKTDKTGFTFKVLQVSALGAYNPDGNKDSGVIFRTQMKDPDEITVDGKKYNIKTKGVIVIPSDLLGTDELTYNTKVAVSNILEATAVKKADYSEYEILLDSIPSKQKSRSFTLRPYVIYEDKNGKDIYYYGNTITRSLTDVKSYTEGNH